MLLPRYVNWSTNIKGFPFRVELSPSCLKYRISVLFLFMYRFMPLAACST